jgi:hypothetical protein
MLNEQPGRLQDFRHGFIKKEIDIPGGKLFTDLTPQFRNKKVIQVNAITNLSEADQPLMVQDIISYFIIVFEKAVIKYYNC